MTGPGPLPERTPPWRLDEALLIELGRRVCVELHHEWRWGWTS